MKFISIVIVGFLLLAGYAFAQSTSETNMGSTGTIREINPLNTKVRPTVQQAFQQQIQQKRAEMQQQIDQKRTALKAQLQKIKDQKKQSIVSRVYENVNDLNKRMTDHFQKALDQISDVLGKIQTRTDTAKANGKDVLAVEAAILKANDAIAAAKTAVIAQAGKIYSFQVSSDATLKKDVVAARQTLHADLVKVRDLVKAAREAVHEAAVTLGKIQGVDELKPKTNQ